MPQDENDLPDAILVSRALQGDGAAFTVLFDRHYASVREFAFRVVLERHTADDVAQEAFIRAARRLDTLRDGQAFVAWVFCIASRMARSHLRAQWARERRHTAAAHADAVDDVPENNVRSGEAVQAMRSLPPKQREAVALVILDGFSHAEAALRAEGGGAIGLKQEA